MLALSTGFVLGIVTCLLSIVIGRQFRLLDKPHGIKIHSAPVPFTGGLALIVTLMICAPAFALPIMFLVAAVLMWAVGFGDDVWGYKPLTKLVLQTLVLLPATFASPVEPWLGLLAVTGGVVLVNAFNVLDGLDGLAGGVAFFVLLPMAFAPGPSQHVAALTAGFTAAFLLLNVNPARIFLGDQGSLLLGFVLWFVASVPIIQQGPTRTLISAAMLWAVPVANLCFVVLRRAIERRSLLRGDRSHLYDVLHRRLGLRATVVLFWVAAAFTGVLAISAT
jgi:UDP-GlcNAc:undecaprenyl-phosphate GlcNAc-1-phosphate transferase